jgi:hypothetical protein
MAQNRPYVYDPSQQIRKDLGGAADSVAQGFQNVLNKKKQEYDFVSKTYEELELIKKDLNLYNNELITKKSNDLLQEAASSIKEKGKLDFTKLGEVKMKVKELADAKRNSDLSVKAADEVIRMMQQNASNMRDVTGTYNEIISSLKDEKNLFSPKNMYESALNKFRDGLDYVKIGQNKLQDLIKNGNLVSTTYVNKRGDLVEAKGVVPQGFQFDKESGAVVPVIQKDQNGNTVNPSEVIARNLFTPEQLEGYKKQIIGAGVMFNDNPFDYISEFVNSSFSNAVGEKVIKPAETLKKELSQAAKAEQDAIQAEYENSDEFKKMQNEKTQSEINRNNASGQASLMNAGSSAKNANTNSSRLQAQLEGKIGVNSSNEDASDPVTDAAGTYSTPFDFKGKKYIRMGKSQGGNFYIVDENGKPKKISEPEANLVINSIKKEERSAAKAAFKVGGQKTTPANTKTMKNTENL